MLRNFGFVTVTTFEDDARDCANRTYDRSTPEDCTLRAENPTTDAPESKKIEMIGRDLTVPATSTPVLETLTTATTTRTRTRTSTLARENENIETMHDTRIYTDSFIASCAELAGYGEPDRDTEDSASTWHSQARRRCLHIRDWLQKMCSCLENGNPISRFSNPSMTRVGDYRRLGSRCNAFEFSRSLAGTQTRCDRCNQRDGSVSQNCYYSGGNYDDENYKVDGGGGGGGGGNGDKDDRIEELRFYNDDHTWNSLVVEKNLRTIDLCQLLKVKRNVSGVAWSIVETWPQLGIERTLEDHEDILGVHRELRMFASRDTKIFVFRPDFLKYEFFVKSKKHCPDDTSAFPATVAIVDNDGTLIDAEIALRMFLVQDDTECPQVLSLVWVRFGYLDAWRKTYMLLRERKLYVTNKINSVTMPATETTTANTLPKRILPDNGQLTPVAHLSDYTVYRILNAKRCFNAPFEWGLCLRPSSNAEAEGTEAGESGLKVIAFHSEKSRVCWLTAMRLAKYGKQLRENYRAFKNKQCEQASGDNPKERYANYDVSNESTRSRVAMDFTGSVGRIVDDPKEAKDIAESEGINWRRTWRPFSRPTPGCSVVRFQGLDDGIHVLQPWFHRGLKRDIAAAIVRDHGSIDGVFLVRESRSNLGAYVLTYKYSDKVFHAQIQPVFDERCNCWLYTLDKGVTKFYDLLQLIEFYQLNAGSLPTRLTHYVQNGVPVPIPRSEDGGASPSPPEACHRFGTPSCVHPASFPGHGSI
ncbi:growth factor receptor-bound protein 14-like isoform X1 [Hylaeus anthracinus]|uniref:growth factor receptor-bound protein 14-like isoform X1 n=1 Tax=Hylaeus anthracinus TaxID=313031 RepID=UPI0023B9BC73|nr:growth factor receptor-bound protein 14-like isoform X1 [Hylaeus anthracinus]XP_054002273.1 growth factor receptor-bound protein 14-like isoform X1 [Hylaeus anthracinus]